MKPACRWKEAEGAAYLYWNYSCIATVKPAGPRFETVIWWCGREHRGGVASLAQGVRFVTRWVDAREGFPTLRRGSRR